MCKVNRHKRKSHYVKGHFRTHNGCRVWISRHKRSGSIVNGHCN